MNSNTPTNINTDANGYTAQNSNTKPNRILLTVLIAATAAAMAGCSRLGVQPWDRDILARPDMQLVSDPIEAALDDHIYFSKEASSGGQGFGGGGCGCN